MGLILVASEDAVEIETIKAALSVHGWWVTVASDRESAIQAAADQAPKLVLVDHELPGSIELVRAFGSANGGPGVLVSVPDGFDGALELKEAGVDELITKPLSPPGLLEVVHRCLAAPRPAEVERPAPTKQLLTTEEIFGDVLRELEEDTVEVPPAPAPSTPSTPATATAHTAPAPELAAPAPAPVTGESNPFESPPAQRPVVSLAGLFDEEPEPEAPAPPRSSESEWAGEERRGPERPWGSSAEDSRMPAVDQLFDEVEGSDAPPPTATLEAQTTEPPSAAIVEPVEIEPPTDDSAPPQEVEPESPAAGEPRRRVPRTALLVGTVAASLLVAAGVIFLKNPGGGAETTPVRIGEPVESPAAEVPAVPAADAELSEPAAAVAEPVEPSTPTAAAPAPPPAAKAPEEAPIESLDLEAIVEAELERREVELRQVFLEEEKRLLRELNKLDESPPAAEAEPAPDAAEESGDGR